MQDGLNSQAGKWAAACLFVESEGGSGQASSPITLNMGANTVRVVVTAEDAETTQTYTVTVTRTAASTTTLSSAPSAPRYGAPVTLTAQVSPAAAAGTVAFFSDAAATVAVPGCTAQPLDSQGQASCMFTPAAAASYGFVAQYLPADNTVLGSASSLQTVIVAPALQIIQFTSTPPTSAKVGGSYSVAATGGASGNPVVFAIDAGSSNICTIAGNAVSFNAKGSCVVTASQAGNANYEVATAPTPQTIAVGQTGTDVQVSSTPNPSKPGEAVSFTVTVTPDLTKSARAQTKAAPVPTGTVTVTDNGNPLGTATLVNGSVTLQVTTLTTPGAHTIIASYSGDANNAAAQSAAYTQTVNAAAAAAPTPVPSLSAVGIVLLNLMAAVLAMLGLRWRRGQASA